MPKIRMGEATARSDDYDDEPVWGTRQTEARTVIRETRDADARPEYGMGHNQGPDLASDYVWRRPTALDAPPPRPGYQQRWVRMSIRNEKDTVNYSNKFREGWQPRDPASLPPEFRHLRGVTEGTGSLVAVGGLVLCEIPEQILVGKRRAIRQFVANQNASVSQDTDAVSREGARIGAPPVVREEKITVERGRRPSTVLAD